MSIKKTNQFLKNILNISKSALHLRALFVFIIILNFSLNTFGAEDEAEEDEEKPIPSHHEWALLAGSLLPYGIPGVRDTYPFWGMKYSHPFQIWNLEYGLNLLNAKKVTLYQASLSVRLDFDLNELAYLIFYFGGDFTYYKRGPTLVWAPDLLTVVRTIEYDYTSQFGGHAGLGVVSKISKTIQVRGDCKMGGNPGTTLIASIGIIFWLNEASQEKSEP